jgi:hypothetical protein
MSAEEDREAEQAFLAETEDVPESLEVTRNEARDNAERVLYEHAQRAAEIIADIMENSESDANRLSAANIILRHSMKMKEDDKSWKDFVKNATGKKE